MGIYIKGMEMPTSCYLCPCNKDDGFGFFTCGVTHSECDFIRLPTDCPLVPVPPHGDLIDRDALMKILSKVIDINASIEQRNEATDQERRCLWWFEQQIGIAPTIIPAEEGE